MESVQFKIKNYNQNEIIKRLLGKKFLIHDKIKIQLTVGNDLYLLTLQFGKKRKLYMLEAIELQGDGNGIVKSRKRKALLEIVASNALDNYNFEREDFKEEDSTS